MQMEKSTAWYLAALVLAQIISLSSCAPARLKRLCGVRLPETLAVVCNHTYNRPSWDIDNTNYERVAQRRHERSARDEGIVEECCLRACSNEQLQAYCGNVNDYRYEDVAPANKEHNVEDRSVEAPPVVASREAEPSKPAAGPEEKAPQTEMRSSAIIGTVAPEILRMPYTIGNF